VDVWLAGLDPVTRARAEPGASSDFTALFDSGAPWQTAASKTQVLQITTEFVVKGSDADLRKTFEGLSARNIALGVAVGFLYGGGRCGYHVEGYAAQHTARLLAKRIKALGGTLAYAAMDEPLWYGRHANGPTTCHAEIIDIVAEIAEGVREIHQEFPAAQIGDIEPIGQPTPSNWLQEITQFVARYRAVVGIPLAFLHADVQWRWEWQEQLRSIAQHMHVTGVPFGIIVDADHPGVSDADWTYRAEARLIDARTALGRLPERLVFQSWSIYPRHFLPEDAAGTLTNLVKKAAP
jgi:hypothetical protein